MTTSNARKKRDALAKELWIIKIPKTKIELCVTIVKNYIEWALNKKKEIPSDVLRKLLRWNNFGITNHANYRISERLCLDWLDIEKVRNDLTMVNNIKKTRLWRYILYWELAKYIVNKDKTVITIIKYE